MNLIAEALEQYGLDNSSGECEGSKFHSPTPLRVERVRLSSTNEAVLCGVCRDNVEIFIALMRASQGELPWNVRREFGNRVRDLGVQAWKPSEESQP